MLDCRWPPSPAAGSRGKRPGRPAVVAVADPDRAPRRTTVGRPVGATEIEAAGSGIDVEAMNPHRIGADVTGRAGGVGAGRRERGLPNRCCDPRRTDGEGPRARSNSSARPRRQAVRRCPARPSRRCSRGPSGGGRPGTRRRTHSRRGPGAGDSRSATSRQNRADGGRGDVCDAPCPAEIGRCEQSEPGSAGPAREPVVPDVDRAEGRARGIAVDGDSGNPPTHGGVRRST